MKILGLGSPFLHDPSAALVVDGRIVAAVEEERLNRKKHAVRCLPTLAARYCLEQGGIGIDDVDAIAFPWSPASYRRDLPAYLQRTWRSRPSRAFKAMRGAKEEQRWREKNISRVLEELGARRAPRVTWVDHHIAHAASCYYVCGWDETAILTIDGSGEFTSTMLGEGRDGHIRVIDRVSNPDSLGFFYSTVTEYLGFKRDDGELTTVTLDEFTELVRLPSNEPSAE